VIDTSALRHFPITEKVAFHLGSFIVRVHRGDFAEAAVAERMARCAVFSEVARMCDLMIPVLRVLASRALTDPPWSPPADRLAGAARDYTADGGHPDVVGYSAICKLPKRSECDCFCHTRPGIMHFGPCCDPDPGTMETD
jgi:hypothetical protein